MDKTTEIRKLPAAAVFKLCQILDTGNAWEKVMAMIPSDPGDFNSEPKYTLQHIKLIQSASEKQNKSCTEILFSEWGTSGEVRPTLQTLLQILVKAEFYRAAEYVAVDLLKDEPPERPLHGPAAVVELPALKTNEVIPGSEFYEIFKPVYQFLFSAVMLTKDKENLIVSNIDHSDILIMTYSQLQVITNNFDETTVVKCVHSDGLTHFIGHKLGTGAFGSVYYGELSNGKKVAVKKLSTATANLKNQFENEIRTLSEYRQENLVSLLGYSNDTEHYCLLYEFMPNGSLQDRLQLKSHPMRGCELSTALPVEPLTWLQRLSVAVDVCGGILFLHTSKKFPLIHRDIKSANILLDEHLKAKVGDFGLVKVKPNLSESKLVTSNVFGTSAYMAPEAFRGDVSVKMDVFSFGVVLLELLTGLPPYDENRDGCDLVTYIEDVVEDSIEFLLDKTAGCWDKTVAQQIFKLSQECLEEKRSRPLIGEVKQKLECLWGSIPTAEMTTA